MDIVKINNRQHRTIIYTYRYRCRRFRYCTDRAVHTATANAHFVICVFFFYIHTGDQRHGQLASGTKSQKRAVRGVDQVGVGIGGEVAEWRHQEKDGNVLVATVLVRGVVRGELVVHRARGHHHRDQTDPTINDKDA